MELKEFITEALLNIADGIDNANSKQPRFKTIGVRRNEGGLDGDFIDFDVSVVVENKSGIKGDGKLSVPVLGVLSAGVGLGAENSGARQDIHHLKFRVWMSESR